MEDERKREILQKYNFWFLTSQTETLKKLFDSLKDLVPEATMNITQEGILLENITVTKTVTVRLQLSADKVKETGEFVCCPRPLRISFDMKFFNLFFKFGNPKGIVSFCIENSDADRVCIIFKGKHDREQHYLKLIDIPLEDRFELPNKFACVKTISTQQLQRHIKGIRGLGMDECTITNISESELRISAKGCIGEYSASIFVSEDDSDDEGSDSEAGSEAGSENESEAGSDAGSDAGSESGSEDGSVAENGAGSEDGSEAESVDDDLKSTRAPSGNDDFIVLTVRIKHLELLIKPLNLCPRVTLNMSPDSPIMVEFPIASLGTLQYYIALFKDPDLE